MGSGRYLGAIGQNRLFINSIAPPKKIRLYADSDGPIVYDKCFATTKGTTLALPGSTMTIEKVE